MREAVGSINVMDYGCYDTINAQALEEFAIAAPEGVTANSMETIPSVVRSVPRTNRSFSFHPSPNV